MKSCLFLLGLLLGTASAAELVPLGRHLDVRSHYTNGEWSNSLRVDSVAMPGSDEFYDPANAVLLLSDKPVVSGNPAISRSRNMRSLTSSSSFDFIGVNPGEYYWRAAQGSPGVGDVWPGWNNGQPANTFGSYVITDPRITDTNPRPWIPKRGKWRFSLILTKADWLMSSGSESKEIRGPKISLSVGN